jgi:hypothetical protein
LIVVSENDQNATNSSEKNVRNDSHMKPGDFKFGITKTDNIIKGKSINKSGNEQKPSAELTGAAADDRRAASSRKQRRPDRAVYVPPASVRRSAPQNKAAAVSALLNFAKLLTCS